MKKRKIVFYMLLCLLVTAAAYFCVHLPMEQCPDEYSRIMLPQWIVRHGTLPYGNEADLVNPIWGDSYAFNPYLPSLVAALLLKVVSLFSSSRSTLFLAVRMTNLFGFIVLIVYAVKLGERIFTHGKYLFVLLIAGLPQVLFLTGYHNNDLFSLLSCVMIAYYLVLGTQKNWDITSCIGLGAAMAVNALSYYFAYIWIFFAAVYAVVNCYQQADMQKVKIVVQKGLYTVGTAFVLAGWYFIRNLIIYKGDLLGFRAREACIEAYEAAGNIITKGVPMSVSGANIQDWIKITLKSLFGVFGYMNVFLSGKQYFFYYMIVLSGLLLLLIVILKRSKKIPVIWLSGLLVCVISPILFSFYRSVTYDYQPQGRYIISAWPAAALLIVCGYEGLQDYLAGSKTGRIFRNITIEDILCIIWMVLWGGAIAKGLARCL